MRTRLLALGAGVALALSGCSAQAADARPTLPPVQVVVPPAASAGGACILWDFDELEDQLGVRFDVAAAGHVDDTSTCVAQTGNGNRPDLMLSVVEQTPADADLYHALLVPAGATRITKLGKAAYRITGEPADRHGPTVEVGWLSSDRQLMTLRFTFPEGAGAAEADDMADKLVGLARTMAANAG